MDKKDIMYMALALGVILVVAIVVKPMMTGQPVNLGFSTATPTPTERSVNLSAGPSVVPTTLVTPSPSPTPRPTPLFNGTIQKVSFVDPSTYGLNLSEPVLRGTRIDQIPENTGLTTYATISGTASGTTAVFTIPFPYWELWYTVEPAGEIGGKGQSLGTSTVTGPKQSGEKGSGSSQTFIQGSFTVTFPLFSVQVMDANDPNRIVRSFEPPGGLDKSLWKDNDPRPWVEKFFEGSRSYYFVINAHQLSSYQLQIRIPSRYLNQTA